MQMKTNKNGVKLLAAVMVFAIAIAGVTVVIDNSDVDAESQSIITFNSSAVVFIDNYGNASKHHSRYGYDN